MKKSALTPERLNAYQDDLVLFSTEALRLTPTPQQLAVLESFQRPGSWTSVRSGHGTGKTACMAICALWHTLLWKPSKTIVTAPTYPQLRDAFMPEISLIVSRADSRVRDMVRIMSDRMVVVGNEELQFMSARTARPGEESSLQGARADYTAYIVDECYGVGDRVFSVITGASSKSGVELGGIPGLIQPSHEATADYDSGATTGSSGQAGLGPRKGRKKGGKGAGAQGTSWGVGAQPLNQQPAAAFRFLMGGNPTRQSGYAYESHNKNKKLFTSIRLNSEESPLVGEEFLKRMAPLKGTDEYRIRVLGEHPLVGMNTLIPRSLAEAAAGIKYQPIEYEGAPLIVGCDPAWMGGDRTAIVLRQGLMSWVHFVRQGVDSVEIAGVINDLWTVNNRAARSGTGPISLIRPIGLMENDSGMPQEVLGIPAAVFVDIGMGNGVIDQLRRLGRNPIPVSFGGTSLRDDCHLKRTEMWVKMAEWLKSGGALGKNDELIGELSDVEYSFNLMGKKVLEGKEMMRERTGRSPDIADALALTFAFDVAAPAPREMLYRRERAEPYDPWREFGDK
jgi:hypothetical protein